MILVIVSNMKRTKATIRNNEQGEYLDTVKQGDTVEVSEAKRPKKKHVLGPVKSLDTALDENYYDSYNP